MKVLVTGFTPFGGETQNPSYEAVKMLPDKIGNAQVVKGLLPTLFGESQKTLFELLDKHNPDAVICVGQAGNRTAVEIEKVAINYAVTKEYDPDCVITDKTIDLYGPAAYFATLPVEELVTSVLEEGIPCNLSLSAGAFVCNYIMYSLLKKTENTGKKCGFVHIPYSPLQASKKTPPAPSMDIGTAAKALEVMIKTLIKAD